MLRGADGQPLYTPPRRIPFNTVAPTLETRAHINRRTGESREVPVGIDPGFDHNPGRPGGRSLDELIRQKLAAAPPRLAQAAGEDGFAIGPFPVPGAALAPPVNVPARPELDSKAREHVLKQGKKQSLEFSAGYNAHDPQSWAFSKAGSHNSVSIPYALVPLLEDAAAAVVLHHNHPRSMPLSPDDLGALRYRGLARVIAHGHDGSRYQAERGINIGLLTDDMMKAVMGEVVRRTADLARQGVFVERLVQHLANQSLHRAKIISYQVRPSKPDKELIRTHQVALNELVKGVVGFIQDWRNGATD